MPQPVTHQIMAHHSRMECEPKKEINYKYDLFHWLSYKARGKQVSTYNWLTIVEQWGEGKVLISHWWYLHYMASHSLSLSFIIPWASTRLLILVVIITTTTREIDKLTNFKGTTLITIWIWSLTKTKLKTFCATLGRERKNINSI